MKTRKVPLGCRPSGYALKWNPLQFAILNGCVIQLFIRDMAHITFSDSQPKSEASEGWKKDNLDAWWMLIQVSPEDVNSMCGE